MRRLQRLSARLIVSFFLLTHIACERDVPSEPPQTVPPDVSTSPTSEGSGDLDTYFADPCLPTECRWAASGLKHTGGVGDLGQDVAIQTDGKIVVGGWRRTKADADFIVARHKANGTIDGSFGDGGKVTTNVGSEEDLAFGVAVQPDGAIIAAGVTWAGPEEGHAFGLVRYGSDGTLDMTFGTEGIVKTNFTAREDMAAAVSVQSDETIVVAGTAYPGDFAIARYTADGGLDTSFSGDGIATVDFGESKDVAEGLGIQADGKIVVSGSSNLNIAVARLSTDGDLDRTFSGDGRAITDTGGGWASGGGGLALQGDGKIVVAGTANQNFLLVRYTPDGDLDRTFGKEGLQPIDIGECFDPDFGSDVAVQPDGKIVEVGMTGDPGSDILCLALARVEPDGRLDRSFGGNGKVSASIGYFDRSEAVALQADGTIVIVGSTGSPRKQKRDLLVTRFLPSGRTIRAK